MAARYPLRAHALPGMLLQLRGQQGSFDAPSQRQLEAELEAVLLRARRAWPELQLPTDAFLVTLAACLGADLSAPALIEALRALHTSDLYLVSACLRGDARAIAAFERQLFPPLEPPLSRLNLTPAEIDETKQRLRAQLFTEARPDVAPVLTGYQGRGSLAGWLRVVAVRTALRVISQKGNEIPVPADALDRVFDRSLDPEMELLRHTRQREFRQAFKTALSRLEVRERNLLRQRFIDRVPMEQLALIYRVHRATLWRWLERAQASVLAHTRAVLVEELRLSPSECESMLRLADSHIDITLSGVFETE